MKKYILSLTLALAALAFTGCSDVWTGEGFAGSTSDFSCAESTATASTGTGASGYETARYATFKIGSSDYFSSGAYASNLAVISQAAPDTEITLTINSYTRLNKDSVSEAVSFWLLQDSAYYKYGAPNRYMELKKEVLDITEVTSSGSASSRNVTTTVDFKVDTMMVQTRAIAVLIDAQKLIDVNGAFVVNGNQNERCGEETDSLVRYIGVAEKYGDSHNSTDGLEFTRGEDFAPKLDYQNAFNCTLKQSVTDTPDGSFTIMSGSASYYTYSGTSSTSVKKMDLSERLSAMYSLQTKAPGSTQWIDSGKLNFIFSDSNSNYRTVPLTLETGTKVRLVKRVPSMEEGVREEQPSALYGHPAHQGYTDSYTKIVPFSSGSDEAVSCWFSNEPQYMVSLSLSGENTFIPGNYDYDEVTSVQAGLFDVTPKGEGKYAVDLDQTKCVSDDPLDNREIKFSAFEDFIVTDEYYNVIPSSVTKKDDDTVIIQIDNHFYSGTVRLWVGNGTTLTMNPVEHLIATKFGIWKDAEYGAVSGYVNFYEE